MSKKSSSFDSETRSIASTLSLVKSRTLNKLKVFNRNSTSYPRKYDEKSNDSVEAKATYMAIR